MSNVKLLRAFSQSVNLALLSACVCVTLLVNGSKSICTVYRPKQYVQHISNGTNLMKLGHIKISIAPPSATTDITRYNQLHEKLCLGRPTFKKHKTQPTA